MSQDKRLYKKRIVDVSDPETTFIKIDGPQFKRPVGISAADLGKILRVGTDEDLDSKNVSAVEFSGQDADPEKFPEEIPIVSQINIAVDENYLYVWVSSLKRWKRIMLGDWPESDLPSPAED